MSAKHAFLALLFEEGPAYPYGLRDRLQQRLGPAWEIDTGHLTRIIKGLERDDLIARVDSVASASSRRPFYAVTEPGSQELARWLDKEPEAVKLPRRPVLVQLTLGGQQRLEADALAKLGAYETGCVRVEKQITSRMREIPSDGPLVRADSLLLRLSLSADLAHLSAEIEWAQQARGMIAYLSTQKVVWPRNRSSQDD